MMLRKPSFLIIVFTGFLLGYLPLMAQAQNHLLDAVMEDIYEADGREFAGSKGGPECNDLTNATTPVRAGRTAFRHRVSRCGERSELAMEKTDIGGTYWYGWSMHVPEEFDHTGHYSIVMQMATWPSPRDGEFPCGGNGHKISISSSGAVEFDLQHAGEEQDSACKEIPIGRIDAMKGRWVDFVMHAKWTGDEDGFLQLWMKIGDRDYAQKIDYTGPTWWNDEDRGPYFKMGLYMGDPRWDGPESRTLYTDEYRLGAADVRFEDVAPPAWQ